MTDEAEEGNLGRRAGTPLPASSPSSDNVTKIIGWIAGGFTLLGGSAGALALIPRTVGAYQNPVLIALGVLLVAILVAGIAGAINFVVLQEDSEAASLDKRRRRWTRVVYWLLSAGCLLVVVGIGIMLVLQAFVFGRAPVARLTMSTAAHPETHSNTVKVNYQADNLNAKTFIVVDVYAFTVTDLNEALEDDAGEHVYRALVGSDASGKADSTIELQVLDTYTVMVAETTPDVDYSPDTARSWRDELIGTSHLCEDIAVEHPRTCAWVRLPSARLPG